MSTDTTPAGKAPAVLLKGVTMTTSEYSTTTISMGIDADLAINGGIVFYLTPCCKASAKGCDGYIGCRACYRQIADELGDGWMVDDASGWERRVNFLVNTGGLPLDMAQRWAASETKRAKELAR